MVLCKYLIVCGLQGVQNWCKKEVAAVDFLDDSYTGKGLSDEPFFRGGANVFASKRRAEVVWY